MSCNEHEETYRGCKITLPSDDSPSSPREWCNVGTMVCWHRRYNLGDEQPKCGPDDYRRENIERATWNAEKERREQEIRADYLGQISVEPDEEIRLNLEQEMDESIDAVEGKMEDDTELCRRLFEKDHVALPLYLYDHSGITMSTGKFSCPWDSGQVGFIYCSLTKAREEWGEKHNPGITDEEIRAKAIECLESEVKTYDSFIRGDVVGYVAKDPDGETIDSCWGFYPDESGCHTWDEPISQARLAVDNWHTQQTETATATTACFI